MVLKTPNVTEEVVKKQFIEKVNKLITSKDNHINDLEIIKNIICNTKELEEKLQKLEII